MEDENNIIEVEVYQLRNEEQEREVNEFIKRWEAEAEQAKKRIRKFKIFTITLFAFVIFIIIAATVSIFLPQYQYITDKFLLLCNFLSTGLSLWTIHNIFKTKLIKEKMGKWLLAVGIFAVFINLFSAYGNLF